MAGCGIRPRGLRSSPICGHDSVGLGVDQTTGANCIKLNRKSQQKTYGIRFKLLSVYDSKTALTAIRFRQSTERHTRHANAHFSRGALRKLATLVSAVVLSPKHHSNSLPPATSSACLSIVAFYSSSLHRTTPAIYSPRETVRSPYWGMPLRSLYTDRFHLSSASS